MKCGCDPHLATTIEEVDGRLSGVPVKHELPPTVQTEEEEDVPRTKAGAKLRPRRKQYCNRMHKMTEDNIYYLPHSGQPMCKKCIVIRREEYKKRLEK